LRHFRRSIWYITGDISVLSRCFSKDQWNQLSAKKSRGLFAKFPPPDLNTKTFGQPKLSSAFLAATPSPRVNLIALNGPLKRQ